MSARRILLLVLAAATLVLVTGQASVAQEPGDEEDEAAESVRGTLRDGKGTRDRDDDEPAEGVEITVTTADGEEIGVAESDEDGLFELDLPGPGQYVAVLDVDTLPDGVGLAEGDETLTFSVTPNESNRLI